MIISIVNNKGGVLKTTLATNLAACFSLDNKKTIVLDLDGQGNVAATFGKNPYTLKNTVMEYLKGECELDDVVIGEREPYLHILPSNDELNYFDFYLSNGILKVDSLKDLIHKLDEIYDYVIIDTPPIMSSIVSTVLSITNVALIPFEPDQYAVLGLRRIAMASKKFIEKGNTNLKVIAIPTKVNNRANIHKEIINIAIRPKLTSQGVYVTNCYISSSTKSTAAVGYERVPIVLSIQKNKFQKEYDSLKNEIIGYINGEEYGQEKEI